MRGGGWNIADCVERSYDVEGVDVGTVAAGPIGLAVLPRPAPFDVRLHWMALATHQRGHGLPGVA